jgi:hypothetical protein
MLANITDKRHVTNQETYAFSALPQGFPATMIPRQ